MRLTLRELRAAAEGLRRMEADALDYAAAEAILEVAVKPASDREAVEVEKTHGIISDALVKLDAEIDRREALQARRTMKPGDAFGSLVVQEVTTGPLRIVTRCSACNHVRDHSSARSVREACKRCRQISLDSEAMREAEANEWERNHEV